MQFGKGAWDTGEKIAILARYSDVVTWHTLGEGFTWETQDRAKDVAAAERAWEKALELMADPALRFLVLDELNISFATIISISQGWSRHFRRGGPICTSSSRDAMRSPR